MKRFLFVIGVILFLFWWISPSQAQNSQTVVSGSATTAISFPAGCSYNWVNNTPGIGLAASGSGDIASFIAVNNGTGPITATIKAAPVGFSYIANQTNPGKVSVYDNASNTLVTTIAVGSNPNAVAASADGTRVYVANTGSKNVSVINTATNAVVATVTVGNLPSGLAVSPDGTRVYVTNNLSSSISIISTASNSVLGAIPLPVNDQPIGIAVSPDGNKLYVADDGPGTVSVIDANTRVKTAVINIGSGSSFPWGITVSPDGSRVYVNNIISNDVTVIDAGDNSIITSIPAGASPNGIAVSPDGSRIYSANGGSVLVIDASTNAMITNIAVGTSVVGVSVSPDGSLLYAIDQSNHSFSVINAATNAVLTTVPLPVGANPASFGNFISTGASCPSQTYAITVYPAVSTITAGPVSGRIAACAGSASVNPAIEQFTVSAFLLTAAVTVTAPAGFEVSLAAGSGYANNVSIAQSGGMVNNQVVYVRSTNTATGTISGMVSLTSGTTTQSVAVSGIINPLPQVNAIPDKIYNNGDVTTPITFTGGANTFTWTVDNTSIGLPSGGNTTIPSFTAFNNGTAPVVATVTIKPINAAYLYNVNSLDNSISAINTYTSEVTTIPMGLGSSVLSLAVSPDGSKVYVVENGPGKLAVVNTKTNAIDALIDVGNAPSGVAVSPDGTRAYVANGLSDNVSVVNTVNNTVIATVNVQSYPYGIAISPDGGRVYASNLNSGTVSVINTANNTVISTITVGSGPFGITVSPDGTRLYVADSFAGKVSVINTATNAVINTVTVGSSPYDIAVSPDGSRVYVSNYSSNTISVINAATNGVISTFPGTQRPYSLAVSSDGNWLYIADAATNIISVVNTTTHAIKTTYTVGNGSSTLGNKITSDFGCPGTPVTFTITVNPTPPTITAGAVSGSITACQGSPSAFPSVQQFTASGNKLTADINVTAPAGFEVSLAPGAGYAGSLVLPQSSGTVGAVIVYVRSAASATGNISGNVTLTSTGAVTQNVAVNGIINALPTVATVSDQEVLNGASTTAINFTGTGDIFSWTNDAPGIGLAASGQGNIAAFTAINTGATAVTAHLTVTPSFGTDAYIVSQGSGTVSVINTATNAIKVTIPVKTNPLGVAASADGSRVYVVNNGSNSVSVINTSTDAVIATIPVQLFPGGIAVSPDGSRIYVANENSNSVSVINTVTNALVTNVTVGTTPYGIAVNPSGTRVYVTNQGSNSLSVINASNNSVIANVTTGMSFPVGVLVSVAGDRVYVTNQNSFNVTVIDANTNAVLTPINAGVQPAGIAQSPDGSLLYVANALSGTVSVLQVATSSLLATYSVGSVPYGISVSPDGNFIYVSNEGSNNVSVINTASGAVVATVALPPGSNPYSFGNFISKGADCSGTPVPFTITVDSTLPIITATGAITGLSTVYGTASASTSFQVSGANLTEGILISPSGEFEVSTDNINFSSSLTIGGAGNVGPVTVYVRIAAGTNVGTYFGNILLTSAGADNVNQPIDNASVNPIPLTITANNITLFYTPFSGPGSPPQVISGGPGSTAFTETGLLSGETIGSVTLAYGPGSYQGDAINIYPGSVIPSVATGGTFDPDNYHITYVPGDIIVVIPPPTITAGAITGIIAACIGTASASLNISQFTVSGSYLTGDITVTAPAGFEVSLSATGGYGNGLTLTQSGGTVDNVLVYVRSAVSGTPGNISGNIILSSAGADDQTVAILGAVNPSPAADAVANQVVTNGDATTAVIFNGTGNFFTWTNDTPGIGLAANGTGDIASFTAINTGTTPVIATVMVTPTHRGLAYITNSGDGTVSVVNTATGGILGTIPVGTQPYGVAITPDGKSMYVTNSASNNVTVINTLTNSVVTIVDVQIRPYGVTVSPDGSRVYVANQISNTVSVIQTSDNSVIANINVGANPFAMVVSADGSKLYVTDYDSGQLTIIRTSDNTVTSTISVGINPTGVYLSHDGSQLYIADPNANENIVTVLNTATNAVITTIPMDEGPENMTATPDGRFLYVANIRSNDVLVINTATNTVLTTIPVGLYPMNISASADGKYVYVSNYNDNSMSVISTVTNTVTSIVSGFNAPTAVSNSLAAGASCAGDPIIFTIKVNIPVPVIIATGALTALTTIYGTPSASTSFTVSAANMTAGVLVTPPAGFEVSTDNIHFSPTVTVGAAGTIASTAVYVRLAATTPVGNYSGDVMLTSAGATTVHVPTVNSTVTPAPLTVIANNVDKTYGATLTGGSGSTAFTAIGLQNSETIGGVTIAYGTGSAAADGVGTYTGSVTASIPTDGTFTASNYNITYVSGDIIVSPMALTITANTVNKAYGTTITGGSGSTAFTVTGLQNSETIGSVTIAYGAGSAATDGVGTYAGSATASLATGGNFVAGNYTITYVPGDIIIGAIPLTITANNVNKPYGTAITGGGGSMAFTVTGLQNSETIGSVTIAYGSGSAATDGVGTYTGSVTASSATGGTFVAGNYTIIYVPGDIIVGAMPLTITANNVDKPYGTVITGGSGSTAFTVTGLQNSETIGSVTIAYGAGAAATDGVGTYTGSITASSATGGTFVAGNYTITYVPGDIIIGAIPLTITANNVNKPYGTAITGGNGSTAFTVTGLQNSETIGSVTIAYGAGSAATDGVGTYTGSATASLATGGTFVAGNYIITYVPGDIIIGAIPLTITANNVNKPYGTAITGGSGSTAFTVTGLKNSETIGSVTIAYGAGSAAGDAPQTYIGSVIASAATGGTFTTGNYIITYIPGNIVVNAAASPPSITTTQTSGSITACAGSASVSPNLQQFTFSGSNLTADITVTAPAGFEVSLAAGSGYSNSIIVAQSGGVVNSTVVYVRSSSTAPPGNLIAKVSLTSPGANGPNVAVNATINALPTVNAVANQSLTAGTATTAVNFTGTGNTFTWANDTPAIGLAASGSGDIASFTALNTGSSAVKATITVTPVSPGFAYISNQVDNTISVINTITHLVTATLPAGKAPSGVSVSADGSKTYVTNAASNTVSVFNTQTNANIAGIPVGNSPFGVWANPSNNKVYVANIDSKNVSVIDEATNAVLATIALGASPFLVTGSPDGRTVYISNGDGTVSEINTATNTVTTTITVGTNPSSLAVSPDGSKFYVVNGLANNVTVYSTANNAKLATIGVGTHPTGTAITPDGSMLYVTNAYAASVSVINTATNKVVATIAVGSNPGGIAGSRDGNWIYVANNSSNSVSLISTATNTVIATIPVGKQPIAYGNFITPGSGCDGPPITFTITVNPAATQPPSLLASPATGNITACAGTASASPKLQQFSVEGAGLTADVIATAPADFEVSLSATGGFGASVTVTPVSGAINDEKVYVRSSALAAAGKISGKITLSTAGVPDQTVPVSGVINPLPTVSTVASQTVVTGTQTNPVNFSGTANSFTWTNDTPAIGLASGGTGNIAAFTAVNTGTSPVKATVTVTPSSVGYAYIANSTSGNVSVINTQTNAVVNTITVGQTPTGVAVSPDGSLVYVANQSSGGISVINTKLNTLLATILTTGNSPTALTVSPDGARLYVVNLNSNDLSVINTSTYSLITTIPVGGYPNGVAVSPDGSKVYVANSTNSITVIDAALNTVKTTIPVGKGPYGLTVSPNGLTLYAAISGANNVAVINTATNTVTTTIPVGQNPLGVAMSPDGSLLYVSNQFAKTISVISTATNAIATTIPVGANPSGISVSADGSQLYVANYNDNTVSAINTATNTVVSTIAVGSNPLSLGNFIAGDNGCSGTPVTFTITVNPNQATISATGALTGLTTVYGTPSSSTSFTVSGTDLTGGISIVPPTGFELSTDNVTFAGPVTVSAPGTVTNVPVYIRLAATTPVGTYSGNITLSSQGAADVSLAMPNSTVTPAPLSITASNINKNYGTAITSSAGSTGFKSAGLKNSENIGSVTLTYGAGSAATDGAGTYKGSVVASAAIGGSFTPGNYTITYLPGDLIVVPLSLTIIADDKTKIYGDPNPVLTVAYIGFINSDGPDILLTQPVITTTAGTTSPVGQYPITASGATAANYTITFLPGTLTIDLTPQDLVIPNTFTPNGDGINDTWNIKNLEFFPNCDVQIFNRYGQRVFASIGYGISWDGTYNNARLPTGTYYYIIDLKNKDKALSGFVAIVR